MAAGKIFAGRAGGDNEVVAADAGKAADAVSKVSGEQILSAIIKVASGGDIPGAKADNARNPIAAAIGGAQHQGAAFGGNMNTDDKIAAAIVLRGMATDGKFAARGGGNGGVKETAEKTGGAEEIGKVENAGGTADAGSVNGIAKGMKGCVEAAKKGGVELQAAAGGGATNAAAGKIFARASWW
ncbi:variable large family protein [Borreliella burgdorferi]|uniref:variable large family protein n=1 Tax=Borreliella burgdorferi TaxID=139 RepID=UPI0034669B49